MNLAEFDRLVRRMVDEIPEEFLAGVAEIVVSPRVVPHPDRDGVFTMGECVPVPIGLGHRDSILSRLVLYHGSFLAVARNRPDFDWEREAWETILHELRHHVEWRADEPNLEAFDDATEHNFARLAGEPFDPTFYRDGEKLPGGIYRIEDDYFVEIADPSKDSVPFSWAGVRYRVPIPAELGRPAFLSLQGLEAPPAGEVIMVVPPATNLRHLIEPPPVDQRSVWVEREDGK